MVSVMIAIPSVNEMSSERECLQAVMLYGVTGPRLFASWTALYVVLSNLANTTPDFQPQFCSLFLFPAVFYTALQETAYGCVIEPIYRPEDHRLVVLSAFHISHSSPKMRCSIYTRQKSLNEAADRLAVICTLLCIWKIRLRLQILRISFRKRR